MNGYLLPILHFRLKFLYFFHIPSHLNPVTEFGEPLLNLQDALLNVFEVFRIMAL